MNDPAKWQFIFTQYRIYADGTVVHEDDFEEYDHAQPYYDDYRTVSVPDKIVGFIAESFPGFDNLSYHPSPDYDFYILSGDRVLTDLAYSAARHGGASGLSPYRAFSVPREVIEFIADCSSGEALL